MDTPSGNFDTREVLSSSAVDTGLSALYISDVSAITTVDKTQDHSLQSMSTVLSFRCDTCGMVCKTSAALHKHQVCSNIGCCLF